jgi:hypothetical protein
MNNILEHNNINNNINNVVNSEIAENDYILSVSIMWKKKILEKSLRLCFK